MNPVKLRHYVSFTVVPLSELNLLKDELIHILYFSFCWTQIMLIRIHPLGAMSICTKVLALQEVVEIFHCWPKFWTDRLTMSLVDMFLH